MHLVADQQRCDGEDANDDNAHAQLVNRRVDELHPHPSYARHQLSVSEAQLSALAPLGDRAFVQPITITRDGIVIDGYARCELARRRGRENILCLEYDIDEQEALRWLLQLHRPSKGFNKHKRSLLAEDLKAPLREGLAASQQNEGGNNGSSNLTTTEKVDMRSLRAAAAGVSAGTFSKSQQIRKSAIPAVRKAVNDDEVSIHKASEWSYLPLQQQQKMLEEFRSLKGTNQTSRRLIQKHVAKLRPTELIPKTLGDIVKPIIPDRLEVLESIAVSEIEAPGQIAYLTTAAVRLLKAERRQDE